MYKSIHRLKPEVARKIAAGEVIDRPAAVVRELMDNALDAGATKISVNIEGGGISSIRVSDTGSGMTKEDLELCTLAHTTSKISSEDDLLSLETLGFRGEALSSIDAVSRLTILTTQDGKEAWKLELGKITATQLHCGTIVSIESLFENFPARRQFLKRVSSEALLCRQTFIEKALAHPDCEFRYTQDGEQKLILLPTETLKERVIDALSPKESASFFYQLQGGAEDFSFTLCIGSPEVIRSDRRDIQIYVNGRRIMEYGFLQAVEYGAQGHFPNGAHPFAFVFLQVNPSLVDFNIHPAKREARFRNASDIHHEISSTVKEFFRRYTIASIARSEDSPQKDELFTVEAIQETAYREASYQRFSQAATDYQAQVPNEKTALGSTDYEMGLHESVERRDFIYLGQVMGTFLAVEKYGKLYIIDQHAAHERILYNELLEKGHETQELLIPYRIESFSDTDNSHLQKITPLLSSIGFSLIDEGDGIWQIESVPLRWNGSEKDLQKDLLDSSIPVEHIVTHLYATIACRAACKDGDVLDTETAIGLIQKAFALPLPVCPHGRPIWAIISREELFTRVKRT